MAEEVTKLGLDFEADTSDVVRATGELEAMRTAVLGAFSELKDLQNIMRNLKVNKNAASPDIIKKIGDEISLKKVELAERQKRFLLAGGKSLKPAKKPPIPKPAAEETLGVLAKYGNVITGIKSGIDMAASAFQALGALAKSVLSTVVGMAAEAQKEFLMLEGFSKRTRFMGLGGFGFKNESADIMKSVVDSVAGGVALARGKVVDLAKRLETMGLRGENLRLAVEGAAISAAAVGDTEANFFMQRVAAANMLGHSIKDMASIAQDKFGDLNERLLLTPDMLKTKFRESFLAIFGKINLSPMLREIKAFIDEFQEGSALATALSGAFNSLFKGGGRQAKGFGETFSNMVKDIMIVGLKLQIMWIRMRIAVKKTFGEFSIVKAAKTIFVGFGAAVSGVAMGMLAIAAAAAAALAPILAIASMFVIVADTVREEFGKLNLGDLSFKAGADFVLGIIKGIGSKVASLAATIKDLGVNAISEFKDSIGSRSPAKKLVEPGASMPQGAELGVKRDAPKLQKAVNEMVTIPKGFGGGAGGSGGVLGGATSGGFGGRIMLEVSLVSTEGGLAQDLEPKIVEVLDRVARQWGTR